MKRSRIKSNADTQREWEKRTRARQIARQHEQGVRTPPARRLAAPGKVIAPPLERFPLDPPATPAPPPKPRRSPTRRIPDPPELVAMKRQVKDRSLGLCEANWRGVCPPGPHRGEHVHHMWLRSQGGPDDVDNGLHVCGAVHTHAHDIDRAGAEERGIIRPRPADGVLPTGWPEFARRQGVTPGTLRP